MVNPTLHIRQLIQNADGTELPAILPDAEVKIGDNSLLIDPIAFESYEYQLIDQKDNYKDFAPMKTDTKYPFTPLIPEGYQLVEISSGNAQGADNLPVEILFDDMEDTYFIFENNKNDVWVTIVLKQIPPTLPDQPDPGPDPGPGPTPGPDPGPGPTPDPTLPSIVEEIIIEDDDVPLSNKEKSDKNATTEETEEILDDDVPLSKPDETQYDDEEYEDILDDDVPLAKPNIPTKVTKTTTIVTAPDVNIPQTGDYRSIYLAAGAMVISGLLGIALFLSKKKRL